MLVWEKSSGVMAGYAMCNCESLASGAIKPALVVALEPYTLMSRPEGMYLIVGTTPETSWDVARTLFEHAGWVLSVKSSDTCYRNCEAQPTDDTRYLLLHSHPEQSIAQSIANGVSPEQAIEAWLAAAKAMIHFYKQHRDQAVMVYLPNLLTDPKSQLTMIAEQLGLPDDTLPTTAHQVEQAPMLERLIAHQLLQQTPGISALLAQMEACTYPLAGHRYSAPALDIVVASQQLTTLRVSLAEYEQQAIRAQQESSQHLASKRMAESAFNSEMNGALAKLNNAVDANRKLKVKLSAQQQQHAAEIALKTEKHDEYRSQLAEVTLQSQRSQEESRQLLEQLHVVQEELEAKYFSHCQLQKQLGEIEALQQADQLAKQKAEKTLQQVRKKRRESDAKYKKRLSKALAMHRSIEKTNRKLVSELAEYRDQQDYVLEVANYQIERLLTELKSVKSSSTFKAAAQGRAKKTKLRGNPIQSTLTEYADLIRQSGLFNEDWYLKSYPDVADSGIDPILHYLEFGAKECRNPSPEFDTYWYQTRHPDVAEAGMNPFLHYLEFGQKEGRSTSRDSSFATESLRSVG